MKSAPFYLSADDPPSKQEILKVALRLFARDGMGETSIRSIAAEAGYTNPAIFKFFESKQAVSLYLFERCYLRFSAEIGAAIRPDRPFQANLASVLQAYAEYFDAYPDAFFFVQDNLRELWPKMPKRVKDTSILAMLRRLLAQGVAEGEVDRTQDPKLLMAAMTGFLLQFARMVHFAEFEGNAVDWASQVGAVVRRILAP